MNKLMAASFVVLAVTACEPAPPAVPNEDDVKAARDAARALSASLKGRLSDALSTQGPLGAIEVCALDAPTITARRFRRK